MIELINLSSNTVIANMPMICTNLQNGGEESHQSQSKILKISCTGGIGITINFVASKHKFTKVANVCEQSGWFHLALDCKDEISQLFFDW